MKDVTRYAVIETALCIGGSVLEGEVEVVRAADFDAAQATIAQQAQRIADLERGRGELVAFQSRVQPWMLDCFGPVIASDRQERNHRFLEEALELVQACGATASEAHQLVDYVYGRAIGEPEQEVGGVMVTLAALCLANGMDMHVAGEAELSRIWTKVEQIRAKQAAKPAMSPLPGAYPDREHPAPVAVVLPDLDPAFEAWWESDGQYCRAGGGSYEKTFAYRAYEAAIKKFKELNQK